jgi:SpoVK/Ycf46/Vps4 family AAA+-type ATPase
MGDSVKRVTQIFAPAKENSPSPNFIDEMVGLLPRATVRIGGQHDMQVTCTLRRFPPLFAFPPGIASRR